MPLTRATLAGELVDRVGGILSAAGLSVARDATNAPAMIAGRDALARVGRVPADPMALADADLSPIPNARVREYVAYATICVLRIALQNCGKVDQQVGTHEQRLSQLRDAIVAAIGDAEDAFEAEFGPLAPGDTAVSTANPAAIPNNPYDPIGSRSRQGYWPYP